MSQRHLACAKPLNSENVIGPYTAALGRHARSALSGLCGCVHAVLLSRRSIGGSSPCVRTIHAARARPRPRPKPRGAAGGFSHGAGQSIASSRSGFRRRRFDTQVRHLRRLPLRRTHWHCARGDHDCVATCRFGRSVFCAGVTDAARARQASSRLTRSLVRDVPSRKLRTLMHRLRHAHSGSTDAFRS